MYPTAEQADATHELQQAYGSAIVKHEETSEPYGLVWLSWLQAFGGVLGYATDRHLFIRPDGTWLAWEMQR